MTHLDEGHYAKKHPSGQKLAPAIAERLKDHVAAGKISCAEAHRIAETQNVAPADVGVALDLMEIRIVKCQNGLFGYSPVRRIVKPVDTVPAPLKEAILENLVNERLSCASSWKIAKEAGLGKMDVAAACEALEVKISPCQLGAF